ncbi:MAG: NHL repeat-containing protein [Spirochaetaceae bacterium]|jgi:DNA-binding beta-propeller fold protein YncE|nr:NHL repeat-containing protein [Spirochaetaceae bacterium]
MNMIEIIGRTIKNRRMMCGYLLVASLGVLEAQQYSVADRNALYAQEEFRLGVQAYNRFAFNEAILSFERALSLQPGEPRILDWLGRAYYRSGLEETALRQWRSAVGGYAVSSGEALLLGSRIETVRNRRSLLSIVEDGVRYVESGRYIGRHEDQIYFKQPTSILPLEDGTAWIVAYGSNELVRIDVNGIIRQRQRGPLNGFDRPYDLARGPDGRLFVSEYHGGRVSVLNADGDWQYYIGSKGQGDGKFVGPQNIAVDEAGYLYVVDYGTRRISKFDPNGTFILAFGNKIAGFPGFLSPTGIAARNGRIYAADNATKQIYMFDGHGRYLGILLKEGLAGPESLRFLPDGRLLAADTNRIIMIDVDSAVIRSLGVAGNAAMRIVGAAMDRNGNVLVANFQKDEVAIMTRSTDLASGIFVQIERVVSDRFPLVTVEISVEDRLRRPIVGLDARNFLLSEKGYPVTEQNFLGAGYRSANADISILMERSAHTQSLQEELIAAMRDIVNDFSGTVVSVVSAGEQPVKERIAGGVSLTARGNAASYSPRWRFDLGLRLAVTDLLPGEKKRAVVFVGAGTLGELAFEQYSLAELGAYLANNGIVFHAVIVGNAPADEKIRYLCNQTGGQIMPLYRPEGIGQVIKGISAKPSGSYVFSYRSQLATDFGRAYLPIEAEVYLMDRSGRDSTGYFPPLE